MHRVVTCRGTGRGRRNSCRPETDSRYVHLFNIQYSPPSIKPNFNTNQKAVGEFAGVPPACKNCFTAVKVENLGIESGSDNWTLNTVTHSSMFCCLFMKLEII